MNNELPTLNEKAIAVSSELGGGHLTLTCRGDHGIAPVFLTIGGRPVTGIATLHDQIGGEVAKWIHNDLRSASEWLLARGCTEETVADLQNDLAGRMSEVTS